MSETLRVLIVDDEPLALDYMATILSEFDDIDLVGRCSGGRDALRVLQTTPIDLMFLDIQMPGLNGFDVVKRCQGDVMPMVVFATAYHEYAIQAFEANAVHYLLKPFDVSRVKEAVDRARSRLTQASSNEKPQTMVAIRRLEQDPDSQLQTNTQMLKRLTIKDGATTHLVETSAIEWIDAAGDYMCVHSDSETYILRSTMKELQASLPPEFLRIHRSTLVNTEKVARTHADPSGETTVFLGNDVGLKVSRSHRAKLMEKLTPKLS